MAQHRRTATFLAIVGLALSVMSVLALLGSDPFGGQVLPIVALVLGATLTLRFGWAACTGHIPSWMAHFFEGGW